MIEEGRGRTSQFMTNKAALKFRVSELASSLASILLAKNDTYHSCTISKEYA